MTREEYEKQKAEILAEKNHLNEVLDRLCQEYHENELKDNQEMYNGKYFLVYDRVPMKSGKGPIIATKYTIYKINNVNFVGNGFIRFDGMKYDIVNDNTKMSISCVTHREFANDLQMTTWTKPDKELTKEEFVEHISKFKDIIQTYCTEIMEN